MKVIYEYLRQRRQHPTTTSGSGGGGNSGGGQSYEQMDGQQQQTMVSNNNNNTSGGSPTSTTTTTTAIIGADSLHINKELGVGEFGVVQQGVWCSPEGKRIQVAIKCLSSQRFDTSRLEFLKEARIMHNISHEHIVRLYGVVLEPSLMLVTELAPLRSLLECLKEPALVCQFPVISLCNFAAQIADGMSYLEHQRLIHRDLAARNILVFAKNKVKISDFGLSRALGVGKDYYQTNFNVNLKLPIAWCAPECINYLKFTSMSDCWAYGVCLWEMFSYGFQPWAALTGQQILEAIDEPSYQRLEQPECCPREYYQLMIRCWQHEPTARPRFAEIVSILPDCRPELVQAVKICEGSAGGGGGSTATAVGDYSTTGTTSSSNTTNVSPKELLDYKIGDIITVLDKTIATNSNNNNNNNTSTTTMLSTNNYFQTTNSLNNNNNNNNNNDSTGTLWKGALNNGKTGYFNPSDCVSYLGQNLPTTCSSQSLPSAAAPSSSTSSSSNNGGGVGSLASTAAVVSLASQVMHSKFIRGFLDSTSSSSRSTGGTASGSQLINSSSSGMGGQSSNTMSMSSSSPYSSRRRLRTDMISRPQGDLVHTGHVGADGAFFGDVGFLDGKYNQVPKQIVAPYRPSLDGGGGGGDHHHHHHNSNNNNTKGTVDTNANCAAMSSLSSRTKWSSNEKKLNLKNTSNSGDSSHEYHEISDEDEFGALESPPFEILDFGPSLVEEVFRELDSIKPELSNEIADSELAINESSVNVKNEVREINLRINKEAAQHSGTTKGKKQAMVKPISASDQMELDSAIAMAKDIATRSMLTLDNEMIDKTTTPTSAAAISTSDSPKTPNSPNKKKFSFKFSTKSSPKQERRTFSDETESIGNIIESITPAAKEAYISLVDKGSAIVVPPPPPDHGDNSSAAKTNNNNDNNNYMNGFNGGVDSIDGNPLRMLRSAGIGGVLRSKVRGNRSFSNPRLPTTAQTAGLARVASARSALGVPPPVPIAGGGAGGMMTVDDSINNELPLPPRDRSRPMLMPLKTHQRRYPLVMPTTTTTTGATNGDSIYSNDDKDMSQQQQQQQHTYHYYQQQPQQQHHHQRDSSPLRTGPVLKQVSCPQPPQTFLDTYATFKLNNDLNNIGGSGGSGGGLNSGSKLAPIPPPKPQRTFLCESESFESEMQRALDNIRISTMSSSQDVSDDTNQTNEYMTPKTITTLINKNNNNNNCDSVVANTTTTTTTSTAATIISSRMKSHDTVVSSSSSSSVTDRLLYSSGSSTTTTRIPIVETYRVICSTSDTSAATTASTTALASSLDRPSVISRSSGGGSGGGLSLESSFQSKPKGVDSDEVRVMQKVLANETNLSSEECAQILHSTQWDVHKAIKCIRLRQQLRSHGITGDWDWAQMLAKFNWNIRQASNYLIATQGVASDATEV